MSKETNQLNLDLATLLYPMLELENTKENRENIESKLSEYFNTKHSGKNISFELILSQKEVEFIEEIQVRYSIDGVSDSVAFYPA